MQRFKTPLNNKENEKASGTSPLRLKINYEARQKFHERSKSPLRESSMNKKLQSLKDNSIHKSSNKNIEIQSKFVEDFEVSPYMKFLNDNNQSLKQSAAQLSKIKPISLSIKKNQKNQIPDLRKLDQKNKQDTLKSEFNTFNNQPSRHRQNSKHLGFSAKVNNLQKINHQISSLLQYVYQNKPKEKISQQQSLYLKPRYANIDQNAKVYQRRVSALQKVEENEPRVSIFNVQTQEQKQIQTKKRKNQTKHEYLDYEKLNKNNRRNLEKKQEETYSINKRQNSQEKTQNLSSKNLRQYQIPKRQFQIPKTQPVQQVFNGTSQNLQQSSKATNQNPDLEFYYESLKKRDQNIENFKKKIYNDLDNNQRNDISRSNQKSISLARHQRLKYKYDLERNDRQNDNTIEKSGKKDIFVTKQQIEIYKDISKIHNCENFNSRTPSIKRFDRSPSNTNTLRDQREEISKIQKTENQYNKIDHGFEKQGQKKIYQEDMQRVLGRSLNKKEMSSRKFQIEQQPETSLTSKIDEQIQKIKNQLKDCTKQKNQLRKKYGDILSRERSSQIRQYQHSSKKQVNRFEQNDFQGNTFNQNYEVKLTINDFRQQRRQNGYLQEPLYNQKNQFQMRRNEVQRQFLRDTKPEVQGQRETQYDNQKFDRTQSKSLSRINRQDQKPNKIRIVEDCLSQQRESHREQVTFQAQRPKRPQNNDYFVGKSPLKSKPQIEITVVQSARQSQAPKPLTPISSKSSKVFELKVQKIQITKPEVTKLGNLLAQRIQIDLKLRQQREKFMKNSNPKKWQQLTHYLERRYNRSMNPIEWQQMLQISPEEHNPFSPSQMSSMSSKSMRNFKHQQNESDQDFSAIGSLVNESMDFFELRLRNKISAGQLKKQKFNFQQLDLSGKGYLSLEDLICFVNLHSGKFYRNRDIIFFVKNILIFEEPHHSNDLNNQETASNYSSSKSSFDYRLSYEFLWNVLTYDQ